MATESVIWTLLPNGLDPRQDSCARRSSSRPGCVPAARANARRFPAFRHWADGVDKLKFLAEVDGMGTVDLDRSTSIWRTPDPATWDLLFGGERRSSTSRGDDLGNRAFTPTRPAMVARRAAVLYADGRCAAPHRVSVDPRPADPDLAATSAGSETTPRRKTPPDGWFCHGRPQETGPCRGCVRSGRWPGPPVATPSLLANRFYDR